MAKRAYKQLLDKLRSENEEAIIFEGYEDCLVGVCYQSGRPPVACYNYELCILKLMHRDGMNREDAVEFFDFNTLRSSLGENTPVFAKLFT